MKPHDLRSLTSDVVTLAMTPDTTEEEAVAATRMLGSLNRCAVGLVRFSGQPPWERHPDDELLHVLDGEVEFTLLTDSGPACVTLRTNSLFVMPRGVWHRSLARAPVTVLYITSSDGNEHSLAEDPRADVRGRQ